MELVLGDFSIIRPYSSGGPLSTLLEKMC